MSYQFNYTPAEIIQQLLIDLAQGTAPEDNDGWPVYVGILPATPDNCISVFDTSGKTNGRAQVTGETQQLFGIQVRVRAGNVVDGYRKARRIHSAFDSAVNRNDVVVGSDLYLVQAVNNTGPVLHLGQNEQNRCFGFSLNALASITIQQVGTGT